MHDEIVLKLAEILFYEGQEDVRCDHAGWTLGGIPEPIAGKRPDVTTSTVVAEIESDPDEEDAFEHCKLVASIARRQGRQFWLVVPDDLEDVGEDLLDDVDEIAVTRLLSFSDVERWYTEKVSGI